MSTKPTHRVTVHLEISYLTNLNPDTYPPECDAPLARARLDVHELVTEITEEYQELEHRLRASGLEVQDTATGYVLHTTEGLDPIKYANQFKTEEQN